MKADPSRVAEFLQHILQAIARIASYTDGIPEDEFSANTQVQDAVIRNVEIMGEAARNIEIADPTFTTAHPDLPLRDIYLMRNRLAHGYFEVDITLVWNAVQSDIPVLRKQVRAILDKDSC